MENIVKKLFLGGSLAVALAVSLTSIATHAVNKECTESNLAACEAGTTATFQLTVPQAIELTTVTNATAINNASLETVNNTSFTATVTSNSTYTISLSAANAAATSLTSGSNTIPASSSVTGGTSGWGIKKKTNGTDNDTGSFVGITTTATPFYTSTAKAANGATTTFNVGIGVSATQPTGTYTTNVVVTAATNP